MRSSIVVAAGLSLAIASLAEAQGQGTQGTSGRTTIRFQAMDLNGDGVITRREWRGNDRSFSNQDWNGDGILSGDEVRPGARREDSTRVVAEDDWTESRFRALDRNADRRLSRNEWPAGELFSRVDRNRDNMVSQAEFLGGEDVPQADRAPRADRFAALDENRDGRLTRNEWRGSTVVFDALDANRDGTLTRAEALGTGTDARDEFRSVDVNGDGAIARNEWRWNSAAFDRLDVNRDGRLSPQEWNDSADVARSQQNPAYRAGYERGRQDGVQAGREDKPRGWDLEGQRELEQADAGYQASLGNRADYQDGYRLGFRRGYREGFGR